MIQDDLIFYTVRAAMNAGQKILEIYNTDFEVEYKSDESPLTLADQASHHLIVNALQKYNIPILSEEGKKIKFEERKHWDKIWIVDPLDGTKEFVKRNGEFTVNIALVENGKPVFGVIFAPVLNKLYWGALNKGSFAIDIENNTSFSSLAELQKQAIKLPQPKEDKDYQVVASRSHLSPETEEFIHKLKKEHSKISTVSIGSSLKICLVAEGKADIYPRFAPTWEWDTAAGHAIVKAMGGKITHTDKPDELTYNKEDLLNPWFVVSR